jgi:hypothetical protein
MPGLKNDWVNGDLFTPAAANDMANAVNLAQPVSTPTAIKTAAYTAAVGELVPADAASGGFTVTLPAAPASGSTVWVKKIDTTTNTVTVQRGNGTDVFNETNGPSLLYLAVPGESVQVQYRSGIWYVVSHSFTVPGLDKRYVQKSPYTAANSYSIDDLNGASVLAIAGTENAAVHWEANNASAAGSPVLKLRAQGSSADVWVSLQPKGAGAVIMYDSEGGQVAQFYRPSASPRNSWRFDNSPTGVALKCYATGSDSNVSLNFIPKGTGNFQVDGTAVLLTGGALGTPSSGTLTNCTFPTLNQNTTGSAATLTTARTIGGVSFNGSANIDLPGVNTAGTQNTSGTAAGLSATLVVGSGGTGATTLTGLVKGNGTSAMTAAVAGTDFVAPGGALGTPSSGTLTNATGLPVSGITASTSAALGVGSIELGHATDTTVTRSAAGVLAVEGVDIPTVSSTSTLTNKTLTNPKINGSIYDNNGAVILELSGQASAVNFWNANNASAAGSPILKLRGLGSSADVWVSLQPKGNGAVIMYDGEGGQVAQFYRPSASPVNSWRFDNSPTGVALKCYAQGTNSNVSLNFIPKGTGTVVVDSGLTLADAATLAVGTSTGTKIATATTQKLGFWNASPAVQPTAVADATDAATVITQLNSLLSRLRTIGLIAT